VKVPKSAATLKTSQEDGLSWNEINMLQNSTSTLEATVAFPSPVLTHSQVAAVSFQRRGAVHRPACEKLGHLLSWLDRLLH
jgi:hypothetical protein